MGEMAIERRRRAEQESCGGEWNQRSTVGGGGAIEEAAEAVERGGGVEEKRVAAEKNLRSDFPSLPLRLSSNGHIYSLPLSLTINQPPPLLQSSSLRLSHQKNTSLSLPPKPQQHVFNGDRLDPSASLIRQSNFLNFLEREIKMSREKVRLNRTDFYGGYTQPDAQHKICSIVSSFLLTYCVKEAMS